MAQVPNLDPSNALINPTDAQAAAFLRLDPDEPVVYINLHEYHDHAQYPADYDGIVSGVPAINWPRFIPCDLWPQFVMNEAKNFVSKAKLDAATAAAVKAEDAKDGVTDGVLDDPTLCTWDPKELVGKIDGAGIPGLS